MRTAPTALQQHLSSMQYNAYRFFIFFLFERKKKEPAKREAWDTIQVTFPY